MDVMNRKSYKDDTKIFNMYAKYKKKCSCGHSVVINPSRDKIVCNYCGKFVFRSKEDEFKYRIKEKLK